MDTRKKHADEQARHARAVASLSRELQAPEDLVRHVYRIELERLGEGASITDFLVVFARKGARACLVCAGRARKAKCAMRSRCPVDTWHAGRGGETSAIEA